MFQFNAIEHPTVWKYLLSLYEKTHHASWCESHSGEWPCDCGKDEEWSDLTDVSTTAERKKLSRKFLEKYSKESQGLQ